MVTTNIFFWIDLVSVVSLSIFAVLFIYYGSKYYLLDKIFVIRQQKMIHTFSETVHYSKKMDKTLDRFMKIFITFETLMIMFFIYKILTFNTI